MTQEEINRQYAIHVYAFFLEQEEQLSRYKHKGKLFRMLIKRIEIDWWRTFGIPSKTKQEIDQHIRWLIQNPIVIHKTSEISKIASEIDSIVRQTLYEYVGVKPEDLEPYDDNDWGFEEEFEDPIQYNSQYYTWTIEYEDMYQTITASLVEHGGSYRLEIDVEGPEGCSELVKQLKLKLKIPVVRGEFTKRNPTFKSSSTQSTSSPTPTNNSTSSSQTRSSNPGYSENRGGASPSSGQGGPWGE